MQLGRTPGMALAWHGMAWHGMEAGPRFIFYLPSFFVLQGLLFPHADGRARRRPDGTRGRGCCPKRGLEQLRYSVSELLGSLMMLGDAQENMIG